MKKVKFGMVWQCYGHQTIDLPDWVDIDNRNAVIEYIRDFWEDVPLPYGDYIDESDALDEEYIETWEE